MKLLKISKFIGLVAISMLGLAGGGLGGESAAKENATKVSAPAQVHEDAKDVQIGQFDIDHDRVRLNSGYDMPLVGIGTWAISDSEAEESVYTALASGMRLIDTAVVYGNQKIS